MYIKDADQTKHHITAIRPLFPNMGIPDGADLSGIGYLPFVETPLPEVASGQSVAETTPEKVGDHYEQRWLVTDMTDEEKAAAMRQAIAEIEAAVDAHLDSVAQSYRFADRTRLSLRAAYPNPWQALGVAFGTWMDTCNAMAAAGLQDVIDGNIPLQTPEQVIAQLPAFVAP